MLRLDAASLSTSSLSSFSLDVHGLLLDDMHLRSFEQGFHCSNIANLPQGVGVATSTMTTIKFDNQVKVQIHSYLSMLCAVLSLVYPFWLFVSWFHVESRFERRQGKLNLEHHCSSLFVAHYLLCAGGHQVTTRYGTSTAIHVVLTTLYHFPTILHCQHLLYRSVTSVVR